MIKDLIVKQLEKALKKMGVDEAEIPIESPANPRFGDYASSIAMKLTKKLKKNPLSIAQTIVDNFHTNETIEKVETVKPGFINFWINKKTLIQQSKEIIDLKTISKNGETILLEFGQPNTHKIPHIGHFFSYVYGQALANILEFTGNHVIRVNYQGDIGLHVAKCLYQVLKNENKIGKLRSLREKVDFLQSCYQQGSSAYENSQKAKREVDELNKKIYEHNTNIKDLWEKTRKWSTDFYKTFEKDLGIEYQRYYFESETANIGKKIVLNNIDKVFLKSKGAIIFTGEKYNLHTRVFINRYGNPTYEAKDIGLAYLKKKEYLFDLSVVATANEQSDYWTVVKKAIELVFPDMVNKIKHVGFGMINLTTGKMASRTGQIINPFTLIEQVKQSIQTSFHISDEQLLKNIVFASIKYSFLNSDPKKNVTFDLEKSIAKEGNSAPYLLYTYVRCRSVLRKSNQTNIKTSRLTDEAEKDILRSVIHFPEIVGEAATYYTPNTIATYLFDLAQKYNLFYQKCPILKTEASVKDIRLFITRSVAQILKNGLYLLGIKTVEKM